MQLFLLDPDAFVSPKAPHSLLPTSQLPIKKSSLDIKTLFPKQFEMSGFCPVCYIDGNKE
jgi:adenylate/nucleoside-diphosphate kinase